MHDLTCLARTCSTLHDLALSRIYHRFDIIWPESPTVVAGGKSIDALTYGLATLCLESAFAFRTHNLLHNGAHQSPYMASRLKSSNHAQYVQKFCLANGPIEWISNYMITKEAGKMLGTLVAQAVRKMRKLESFVWDMPTGVLSEVFMALASLQDHNQEGICNLQKVCIRWHDNGALRSATRDRDEYEYFNIATPFSVHPSPIVYPKGLTAVGYRMSGSRAQKQIPYSFRSSHVEYPTFSVLPPLKCLGILDIDELSYLDEASVLIERSKDTLRDLRVGLSMGVNRNKWAQPWDGADIFQVDRNARWPGETTIPKRRLGGVLGVLLGRIYDLRRCRRPESSIHPEGAAVPSNSQDPNAALGQPVQTTGIHGTALRGDAQSQGSDGQNKARSGSPNDALNMALSSRNRVSETSAISGESPDEGLEGMLRLESFSLERVSLSIQVCAKAIDWTTITSLTILDCLHVDHLWKMLRKNFKPTPDNVAGFNKQTSPQYRLPLKKIHTNSGLPDLLHFLNETLAPNSLQVLFLQERQCDAFGGQPVKLKHIFSMAVKRHKSSLEKLLINSTIGIHPDTPDDNDAPDEDVMLRDNGTWKTWSLSTEILEYLTSGRVPNLKELSVCIDYNDWVSTYRLILKTASLCHQSITYP